MQNKAILFGSLLLASTTTFAQSSLLEAAGKQVAKEAVTTAAPQAAQGAATANQALENTKDLKQAAESAPTAVKQQAEEQVKQAAEQQLQQAVPGEIKQGAETAKQLKGKVDAAPKSTSEAAKAVKSKAKAKATDKALDLLR